MRIDSPRGAIELSDARASVEVLGDGSEDVYVLRGAARAAASADRATAGERLTLKVDGSTGAMPLVEALAKAHAVQTPTAKTDPVPDAPVKEAPKPGLASMLANIPKVKDTASNQNLNAALSS